MSFGENTFHPLRIEDAREAVHAASELQRSVEDAIRRDSRALAEAERAYRRKLSERILALKAEGIPATVCRDVALGEREVSDLRYARDVAAGVYEATGQQAFRRGADRRDAHELLRWSEARDLRTDAEPGSQRQWAEHQPQAVAA